MFKYDSSKQGLMLGKGGFGEVYIYNDTSGKKAVKIVTTRNLEEFEKVRKKVKVSFTLNHKALLPVKGYDTENLSFDLQKIYILMDKMKQSLHQYLTISFSISFQTIIKCFYSIISAVEYIHQENCAHRDIRPLNILINKDGDFFLSDLGLVKYVQPGESSMTNEGARFYRAPELTNLSKWPKAKECFAGDIWALGLTMLQVCLAPSALSSNNFDEIQAKIKDVKTKSKELEMLGNILETMLLCYNAGERKIAKEIRERLEREFSSVIHAKVLFYHLTYVNKYIEPESKK